MDVTCSLCNFEGLIFLGFPTALKTVTTSGIIVESSFNKLQCPKCGLVQRKGNILANSDFYEKNYFTYYSRAGAKTYDKKRYEMTAEWMISSIVYLPEYVLDIGCGAGWQMIEMQKLLPQSTIMGVEPSVENCKEAKAAGFVCRQNILDTLS